MSDADELRSLILWARDNGIRMHTVTVGAVAVQLDDIEMMRRLDEAQTKTKPMDARPVSHDDALRRWGGSIIADLEAKAGGPSDANTTYIDEDEP